MDSIPPTEPAVAPASVPDKRDVWYTVYRNFLALAILAGVLEVLLAYFYVRPQGDIEVSASVLGLVLIFGVIWLGLAYLFKTRHKWAIALGLLFVGLFFVGGLLSGNLVALLIHGYFLYLIYKASKTQSVA